MRITLAIYWLLSFATWLIAAMFLDFPPFSPSTLVDAALMATVLAPLGWLRYEWAPRHYAKRQARKRKAKAAQK